MRNYAFDNCDEVGYMLINIVLKDYVSCVVRHSCQYIDIGSANLHHFLHFMFACLQRIRW